MIRSFIKGISAVGTVCFAVGCAGVPASVSDSESTDTATEMRTDHTFPTRERAALSAAYSSMPKVTASIGGKPSIAATVVSQPNNIAYHGGALMLTGVNVYFIWYGNWAGNSATTILPAFTQALGGSPYFDVNTTYYDVSNVKVKNKVTLAGSTTDNYSKGKTLTDAMLPAIVKAAITSKALPNDTDGVYFVLGAPDVQESSGLCTAYCGFHDNTIINNKQLKYAFIGSPDRCPSSCEPQATSPNGNAAADAMVWMVAQELNDAVTNPNDDGWFNAQGTEVSGMCDWFFIGATADANGVQSNVTLGGANYLLQSTWMNSNGGGCSISH